MRRWNPSCHSSPSRTLTRVSRAVFPALMLALTVSLATTMDLDRRELDGGIGSRGGGVAPANESSPDSAAADLKLSAARAVPAWRAPLTKGPRVGTFNVLGATHTEGKGARKGYQRYAARLRTANRLLRWHRLSVVGLQEFQFPQRKLFFKMTGRRWAVSPNGRQPNEIIWQRSEWRMVKWGRFRVRYLHGQLKSMPYVLLQRTKTRKKMWFINVHNPASVGGSPARHRRSALRREARMVRELRATGHPVMLLGDLNDRRDTFCFFAKRGMRSSAGGAWSAARRKPCRAPRDLRIDWVLGQGGKARMGGHRVDVRPGRQRASDHPIVVTSLPRFRR